MTQPRIVLEVFSDFVCPFCYLELPELEAIRARFGEALGIRWRAFELRPEPQPPLAPDYLHDVWQRSVLPMAKERDMTLRLPRIQPRSRLAHEAHAWAETHSPAQAERLRRALFRGFFEESLDLGDIDALMTQAEALGLDGHDLARALHEGRFAQAVRDDQHQAQVLGISGVPGLRFMLDGEHAGVLEGAQPRRQLLLALERLFDLMG
ncbi:DsbA family protein [Halomonas pacifica]|uniref:DsbA family oxidoreductase n=1 Tax=Bisbaumannia pacifica TaxID=77098 RepID=UPI002359322D|nr:DsbA family protein [Halomonas pacifica]MDC8804037.1 DsbA family protein [Halomonas pacifica]